MNCVDARAALAAHPASDDAALANHLAHCGACAAYAADMRALDSRLLRAMQVAVPPIALPAAVSTPPAAVPRRVPRRFALAAGVAAAAVLAAALWSAFPRETLAAALVDHMAHEPHAWESTGTLPSSAVAYALSRAGVQLAPGFGDVSYLELCWFRGDRVPHLVVPTERGPATVVVLPRETVATATRFAEEGYRGVLVPAPRGALAVLARGDDVDVEAVAARALAAIRYVDRRG